jgi:16S rRNA (cytosine967-C5)-methyltransferase
VSPAVSPARAAAFDILLRVERESSYASELLHSRNHASLSAVDQSLLTELVMGTLRWRQSLDAAIAEASSQPLMKLDLEVLTALRIAVYQLRFLARVPSRAAIHESVELVKRARKRSAAPFVNAVLRKLAASIAKDASSPNPTISGNSAEALASGSSHPLWLVERWIHAYGVNAVQKICEHNQAVPITAIRLRYPDAETHLHAEGIELAPGALIASARRVRDGNITRSTGFRAGLCVIQDEASQLVAELVGHGSHILDCCAAPGGKTLAIADRNPKAQITASDLHPHRVRLLERLLNARHSAAEDSRENIHVLAADAQRLPFAGNFDRILVDAPCSGTGTLARNPEIKWRLTHKDLLNLQGRQIAILRSALSQVAVGGRLIYSTCSLEREENEDVVEQALLSDSNFRVVPCAGELDRLQQANEQKWPDLASLTSGPYLRTLPGTHPCDGFFAAILERTS